ncbi:hypothetical protein UlMin_001040 [Ulmus minor]
MALADEQRDDLSPESEIVRAGSTSKSVSINESLVVTPDVHGAGTKIERARSAYEAYAGHGERPSKLEVFGWCFYGLCSYFIHTVLIPIVFPLIIAHIASSEMTYDDQLMRVRLNGSDCSPSEMLLYQRLTKRTITVHNSNYSPLEWTSISWALGLILAAPTLAFTSILLDRGPHQTVIATAATAMGAIFCLPTGLFRTVWTFPPYIAIITAASTVAASYHTRHLGLMVRGFTGTALDKTQFPIRRAASSWLSLSAAAGGSLGAAVISSFAYHMLKEKDKLMSLWIVSIFSGLKWLLGILHFVTSNRFSSSPPPISTSHAFSVFKYPHAIGTLAGIFLSSLTTMCIFTGAVLFLAGKICFKPKNLLYFWLTYFIFPVVSLPLSHPLQHAIKSNAVKMQLLGFFLSAITAGVGFYYRKLHWETHQILFFAAVQGSSTGILYAFGRVLMLDCSPAGKEGAFSSWFSWVRVLGSFVGFAIAAGKPGKVGFSFGVSFVAAISAMVVLIFGNVSDFGGAIAAGHVIDEEGSNGGEEGSPVNGVDSGGVEKLPLRE